MDTTQTLLDRLRAAFTDQLGGRIVDSFQQADDERSGPSKKGAPDRDWLTAVMARSIDEPLTAVVAREVELQTHGIIQDRSLGTLALIHVCPEMDPNAEQERDIEQAIHDAIHLRQVLRERARKSSAFSKTPYSVELVLVVDAGADAIEKTNGSLSRVGDTLREIMARSGFLHAIGVSVLHVDPEYDGGKDKPSIDPGELRRAFPWLLTDVRRWLREASPVGADSQSDPFDLQSIELRDFRGAGSRKWDPTRSSNNGRAPENSERHRLHLIHGANGSGKSSFTEAIELALTDRIARLERSEHGSDERPKYVDVLTNRQRRAEDPAKNAAEISLNVRNGVPDSGGFEMVCRVGDAAWQSTVDVKGKSKLAAGFWERLRGTQEKQKFLHAGAFRLDQVFSDRIVGSSPAERAELFLNAFFPDGGHRLEAQKRLGNDFEKAWDDLPEEVRADLRVDRRNPSPEQAIGKLSDLVTSSTPAARFVRWSGLEVDPGTFVPDSLPTLKAHWPADAIKQLGRKQDESRRDSLLTQLDDSFAATERNARTLQSSIETALPLLQSLDQWEARSGAIDGTIEEFAGHLNDWLERHADWDLAEKSRQLVETKLLLSADGDASDSEGLSPVADDSAFEADEPLKTRLNVLTESARRLDSQREEAHRRVLDFRLADDAGGATSIDRPHLSTSALEALDRVTATRDSDSLSVVAQRVVQSREPEELFLMVGESEPISAQVGRPGGLKQLIDHVERQLSDVQKLLTSLATRKTPFAQLPLKLKRLRETAEACQKEGSQLIGELKKSLDGPLQKALNELLALMTPARWAYRDVISDSDFERRTNELNFVLPAVEARRAEKSDSGEPHADEASSVEFSLLLNTAELNSFALALFLLCAPKLDNPLRLLVLDDPFQNMDELTVATISRAVGRLMRLWQNEAGGLELWNLLVLVHGEGTMGRIRNEVACSAAYLPWLQPKELDARTDGGTANDGTGFDQVEMEDSLLSRELDHPARQNMIEIVGATS